MADDNSWVFDSLVCFLHGPIWNAPLQTFIEEKSLIFDPNEQIDESNPIFKQIHDEYKNLVDFMLGSFMDEMQITPEQFERACLEGRHLQPQPNENDDRHGFSFHQGLFQQIWAANDIRIFNRMMTQRNVELQLQALDLIQGRQHKPASTSVSGEEDENHSEDSLDRDIAVDHELEKNIEQSVITETTMEGHEPAKYASSNKVHLEPIEGATVGEPSIDEKFKRLNLFFESGRIDAADIKSRQEYLKNQRDKILEIKKKARTRQLNESVKKNGRPSSAQIAQKIMKGEIEGISAEPPEASVLLRQTLAKRLRSEVVDHD